MKLTARFLTLALLLAATACTSWESADLTRYGRQGHTFPAAPGGAGTVTPSIPVTIEPLPKGTTAIGLIAVQQDGFYILGMLPVVSVSLQECLDYLVKEALKVGADGIAKVTFDVQPADVLSFSVFPIPDWSATISVQGTAYKRTEPSPAK